MRKGWDKFKDGSKKVIDKARPDKVGKSIYDGLTGKSGGIDYHTQRTSSGDKVKVRGNPFKQKKVRGYNTPDFEAYRRDIAAGKKGEGKTIGAQLMDSPKQKHIIGPALNHQQRMRRADPERMRNQPWSTFQPGKPVKQVPARAGSGRTAAGRR